jgi:S-adenosylmethionine:diacylglycerol 3-amino-3-carboxypropyl transferase
MTHAPLPASPSELLTAAERDLIRREFCVRFGCPPRLADGVHLRVWRTGLLAGRPKIPVVVQNMVERGLMTVAAGSSHMARAHFTEAGLVALRWLAAQRRGLDPVQFAHLHQELGLEALTPAEPRNRAGA